MSELATRPPASTPERALSGAVVDPRGLAARAAEVAPRQRSPETRRTYAAVYWTDDIPHPDPSPDQDEERAA